jgi:uncharacterized protein YecE (DUF72 family)
MDAIIGTAGWSIAAESAEAFPSEGTSLERYSSIFRGVEINSSFHRPHRASTWARWAESVPDGFRFAVKLPKTISHERKLAGCGDLVERFLEESAGLGAKLGLLLLQLPPKLGFEPGLAEDFLADLAARTRAPIACEPRHPGWFEPAADALLARLHVARVAADPGVVPAAGEPGGWRGLSYWRLHGSPAIYRSAYGAERLEGYAAAVAAASAESREIWCMFDNTASSAATADALALRARLEAISAGKS